MGTIDNVPLLHRFPFWFSWNGFRGSQFIWAILGKIKKFPEAKIIQLPNTFPLIVNEKDWISKTIYQGTYERSLLRFLDSLVLTSLVLDVGANIGVTLWHALKNSHPSTKFFAFEPSKQCAAGLLLASSKMDRKGHLLEFAIGDTNETHVMHGIENQMHSGGASLISHAGLGGHSEDVQVRTLDSIVKEFSIESPISLLKIDTEGYESHVVGGAHNLLRSGCVELIIMEVSPNFGEVTYLNSVNELLGDEYRWFALEEKGTYKRKPYLRRISPKASLEESEQWNLVLIRDDIFRGYSDARHPAFIESKN